MHVGAARTNTPTMDRAPTRNTVYEIYQFILHCVAYDPNSRYKANSLFLLRSPLKMFIDVHHQNITAPSPQHYITSSHTHTHTSPRHHRDTPENQHITKTSPVHAEDILTHPQRIIETPPKYHRNIGETQPKPRHH